MRGNILTQTNWQVKAVFTLTVLFATCLLLTDLIAEYDVDQRTQLQNVWGEAYVSTSYDHPHARGYADGFLMNNLDRLVRRYFTFKVEVTGPGKKIKPKQRSGHGDLPGGERWVDAQNYSFHMGGKPAGHYTVTASSDLTAKVDFNNNGQFDKDEVAYWKAKCSTDFRIEEPF